MIARVMLTNAGFALSREFDYIVPEPMQETAQPGERVLVPFGARNKSEIIMRLENGAIAVIDNSRQAVYGFDQRIEAFGSKGCVRTENKVPTSTLLYTADSVESEKPLYFFPQRYERTYGEEISRFAEAIADDTETPVTGIDGLRPMLIGLAVKEALQTGAPVRVRTLEELNI